MRSAGCDIMMDVIADREAQGETRLRISKPYYRTGVALAVPSASKLTSFKSLDEHTKVGVQVGSMAAMIISQRHVPTSTFGFEVDSLEALANREIDAAAVTPTIAAYFDLTHPAQAVRILDLDESEANLNWNVAVGMVRPDESCAMPSRRPWSAYVPTARSTNIPALRCDPAIAEIVRRP